jgi:uncharacterized membrane protein (UPF0127 family)
LAFLHPGEIDATEKLPTVKIELGSHRIIADVAATDRSRIQGLLGRIALGDDEGMLLDFVDSGLYAIHMQGMMIPIDAVWIDSEGIIRQVYEDIRPNSGKTYPSAFRCRYCLELKSGFCRQFSVRVGQKVKFE